MHLQPSIFLSVTDPPVFPGLALPGWLPRWVVRAIYRIANRTTIDPPVRKTLEPFRSKFNICAVDSRTESFVCRQRDVMTTPAQLATQSDERIDIPRAAERHKEKRRHAEMIVDAQRPVVMVPRTTGSTFEV